MNHCRAADKHLNIESGRYHYIHYFKILSLLTNNLQAQPSDYRHENLEYLI
ncbi:hypothetical protein D083_4311 [Dickeya solani RNS 08.23.3.1.A]|nr:hypothetical protein D083_4311 [Dickeya solani RNS 08.23.3.1.A]